MGNDRDSVDDSALDRKHERADSVEDILESVRRDLGTHRYPVSSEELATEYADRPMDLPNETESLGSVFDRVDGDFEDEAAAFEAVATEIDRGDHDETRFDSPSEGPPYWDSETAASDERSEQESVDNEFYDSTPQQSKEHAREAQTDETEQSGTNVESDDDDEGARTE